MWKDGGKKPVRWDQIWLTGFMGSGKSRVAKDLEPRFRWERIDTDRLLRDRFQKTIDEIFKEKGEAVFRSEESAILSDLESRTKLIVSLGGGSLLSPMNQEIALRSGILVYMETDLSYCIERVEKRRGDRPLFTGWKDAEKLFEARRPGYERAHWWIKIDEMEPEEVAQHVFARYREEAPS